eukprot:5020073-Lingulodinium_polyedra.AAC.1
MAQTLQMTPTLERANVLQMFQTLQSRNALQTPHNCETVSEPRIHEWLALAHVPSFLTAGPSRRGPH